ncbi:MAG: phosphopyruvate hydratase [Alphaproteobacteria bacterium]|nr:MAG: phosphopyruvate hydratase [Alphaproteobacteria bacterium]
MIKIENVKGRQILDSRGNPTVEVDIVLSNGLVGSASVPSGASTGKYEAVELRDGFKSYHGKGVTKAIDNVDNDIKNIILGRSPLEQTKIDNDLISLDGTSNKNKLGANAILGVSMAVARAGAVSLNQPLYKYIGGLSSKVMPVPLMNIINGGAHANNLLDIQEFMIMPINFERFSDALRAGTEIFHNLKKILDNKNYSTSVGDEGGFAPKIDDPKIALDLISKSIEVSGYRVGEDIFVALDAAASEFYKKNKYILNDKNKLLTTDELIDYWGGLIKNYPIISIEDPFDEDDINGFAKFTNLYGKNLQIVGDDLFVTSEKKLSEGIQKQAGNSILIKLNQVGTLTETLDTITKAKKHNFNTIISHRSGETEDNFISDLCVGINAGQIKTGSLSRSDRTSKYNQLLRIEEQLGEEATFIGNEILDIINKE